MDRPVTSPEVVSEIRFLLSLLRISYPGEPAPRASGVIEGMFQATAPASR